jgi:phosphoenolpyruvate carboxykinase (ATP)
MIIGGSQYAGEIKKSILLIMNYLLTGQKCLVRSLLGNIGTDGDVALFFGLSGTGKTTLSADPVGI